MRVLLDTVAFIFAAANNDKLSSKVASLLEQEGTQLVLSSVSLVEMAVKVARGKLLLSKSDIVVGLADLQIRVLPYTQQHALQLFDLPVHHLDPFDRQIISQAIVENIPVITCDESFDLYSGLKVIW